MKYLLTILAACFVFSSAAFAEANPSPKGAQVYFANLEDGQTVKSPFRVVFGLKGMGVAPAGVDPEEFKEIGHHHIFINAVVTDDVKEYGIPFDDQHLHYGKGQTEADVELPPGTYKLKLVFGDPYHLPHNPVVSSEQITITVVE